MSTFRKKFVFMVLMTVHVCHVPDNVLSHPRLQQPCNYKTDHILVSHFSLLPSGVPRNFVRGGGGQQMQLRTEDTENEDLGMVAP